MIPQLQHAFERADKLPVLEQNVLADALIVVFRNYEIFDYDDESQWDKLFQSPASQEWLEKMVSKVEDDINQGKVFDFDPAKALL